VLPCPHEHATLRHRPRGQGHRLRPDDVPGEAATLLGLGRSSAYEMVQQGTWPTPLTPAGQVTRRILTLPLLQYAAIPYEFVNQRQLQA
jgi:hypothetical protein